MFRARITFAEDAIVLDDEHVPFASIEDANVEDGMLVLAIPAGTRRVRLKSSDAMTVLDGVLDGIARTHPGSPYRTPGVVDPTAVVVPHAQAHRLRRPTASTGAAQLMIGRTYSAG